MNEGPKERNLIEATLKARERDLMLKILNARLFAKGGFELERWENASFDPTYNLNHRSGGGAKMHFKTFEHAFVWALDYLDGEVEAPNVPDI